jgi:hypothetical protein
VHNIEAQFCGCYGSVGGSPNRIQLLRSGLLSPTHVRPISAFTFDVLETFHLLTLQGKTNAYDFYLTLAHKSDNTGLVDVNVSPIPLSPGPHFLPACQNRYQQFLTAIRMWRNLKLLKRSGRAHDPGGVEATKPGDLAVECPACPHPGRNLPQGWQRSGPTKR